MSKWDKLITRICNLSKDLRFDELRKVLESYGYEMNAPRSGSSHYTFRETLIKSLSDFTLEFLYMTRNSLTRTASFLRKAMTKSCIKILVKSDSAIESAFP